MKFLVDAQLPPRLAQMLSDVGHDAVHTINLPQGNRTPDATVASICTREGRILITKDADFVNSYILSRQPPRLLLVSTGNIRNADLEVLVRAHLGGIVSVFAQNSFIELTRTRLVIHG